MVANNTPQRDFTYSLTYNSSTIKELLGGSADFIERKVTFLEKKDVHAACFYIDGLVNTQIIEKIVQSLMFEGNEVIIRNDLDTRDIERLLEEHVLMNTNFIETTELESAIKSILSGDTVLLVEGCNKAFQVPTKGWAQRGVSEPQAEQVVRGPRDGFTESIRVNTALVRRRIRDTGFRLEELNAGKRTKTDINIAYINGIVKKGLVDEVKERLNRIDIDGILESGYIEELIRDAPLSPFTTIMSTERPDKVASSLLEGRVAIFVDNTPFVLVVPTYFWEFLQASDDYYLGFMAGSFFRIVRYTAFILSLTLTSIYVMLVSFHQEMIPTPLALTIASGREVVPFPVLLEALLMELTFELMREAGLRMPKPVGSAVSIVGSLVIGQAAVQAGIVSPFMVIIVATTGISSFVIPNYSASYSIRLIRFPLLIASGTLGLLGFASMFALIAIHALSIRSFGESYLAPATPFQPQDQKDTIFRMPWWAMKKRPQLADNDTSKIGESQLPQPPKGDEHGESTHTKAEETSERKEPESNAEQQSETKEDSGGTGIKQLKRRKSPKGKGDEK
ncbi:spore germination protein [Niallia sp. MER 6]|uniref:spore germination protein n=1 Tax=Niallia sp. MER 6 TaxID=2939567 RepID=UPI00203D0B32|nr:spore germination protein [Niallia sp. MER 6]MCM3029752.1 spore germination protein [Niallia sp. MER 6]